MSLVNSEAVEDEQPESFFLRASSHVVLIFPLFPLYYFLRPATTDALFLPSTLSQSPLVLLIRCSAVKASHSNGATRQSGLVAVFQGPMRPILAAGVGEVSTPSVTSRRED